MGSSRSSTLTKIRALLFAGGPALPAERLDFAGIANVFALFSQHVIRGNLSSTWSIGATCEGEKLAENADSA